MCRSRARTGEPSRILATFLTLLKRFTPAGHLTTSSWRRRKYDFQRFYLTGSKFHLLAAGGGGGGFMFRPKRVDEEYIYSTVKRVVNCVWEERKGSEAKHGCSSLVVVLKSCCQTEIINTILFNKKIPAVHAFGSHSILKTYQAICGRYMWYTLKSCNPRQTLKERCDRVCGYGSVQSS